MVAKKKAHNGTSFRKYAYLCMRSFVNYDVATMRKANQTTYCQEICKIPRYKVQRLKEALPPVVHLVPTALTSCLPFHLQV